MGPASLFANRPPGHAILEVTSFEVCMAPNTWFILLAWNVLAEARASGSEPHGNPSRLQAGNWQEQVLHDGGTKGVGGIHHLPSPSRLSHPRHMMRREPVLTLRNPNITELPPRYRLPGADGLQNLWVDSPWYTDTDDSGIMVSNSACQDGSNTLCVGILAFSNAITIEVTDVGDFGSNQWAVVLQPDTLVQPGLPDVQFNVAVAASVFVCQYVNDGTSIHHAPFLLSGTYGFAYSSLKGPKLDLDDFDRMKCFNTTFLAGSVTFPRSNYTLTLVRALSST